MKIKDVPIFNRLDKTDWNVNRRLDEETVVRQRDHPVGRSSEILHALATQRSKRHGKADLIDNQLLHRVDLADQDVLQAALLGPVVKNVSSLQANQPTAHESHHRQNPAV